MGEAMELAPQVKRMKYCINNEWFGFENRKIYGGDEPEHRRANCRNPLLY